MSYPQKPRFSLHQIKFGALIFMLSQQHKINALRCFSAISEQLVLPENLECPENQCTRSGLVHRFWSADALGALFLVCEPPRCIYFGLLIPPGASIFGSQKYIEMLGTWILVRCNAWAHRRVYGYNFCSFSLIMKMKTDLLVMSKVIVVITTMMTMKKT